VHAHWGREQCGGRGRELAECGLTAARPLLNLRAPLAPEAGRGALLQVRLCVIVIVVVRHPNYKDVVVLVVLLLLLLLLLGAVVHAQPHDDRLKICH